MSWLGAPTASYLSSLVGWLWGSGSTSARGHPSRSGMGGCSSVEEVPPERMYGADLQQMQSDDLIDGLPKAIVEAARFLRKFPFSRLSYGTWLVHLLAVAVHFTLAPRTPHFRPSGRAH